MEKTGLTTGMLIQAIQYAADHADSSVLICMGDESELHRAWIKAKRLATAMGFDVTSRHMWSFQIPGAELFIHLEARYAQHAEKLAADGTNVMTFFDHRASKGLAKQKPSEKPTETKPKPGSLSSGISPCGRLGCHGGWPRYY